MVVSNDVIIKIADMKIGDAKSENQRAQNLKNLIDMDNKITDEQKEKCKEAGIELYTFEQVLERGRKAKQEGTAKMNEPTPDDCFMIMYTSGTTGDPKGVKMTHRMNVQLC